MSQQHENGADSLRSNGVALQRSRGPVVITGGLGFIGTNLAMRLLQSGCRVILFDDFSREGAASNARLIVAAHPRNAVIIRADVRKIDALRDGLRQASAVFHFAAQVAVTSSIRSPSLDFDINAQGTLKLLEVLRNLPTPPLLVFTSTNKVYGRTKAIACDDIRGRYLPRDPELRRRGFDESLPLSFESPYGCSKGAADQYVLDYAATFGLPALVFRLSCIYGLHQHGTQDQGWVSYLLKQLVEAEPITLFGDGKQVRDILYVDDLVDAFLLAISNVEALSGQAFNLGGGPENAISLLELLAYATHLGWPPASVVTQDWRIADQRYFVCDTARFRHLTGWRPRISWRDGVSRVLARLASSDAAISQPVKNSVTGHERA